MEEELSLYINAVNAYEDERKMDDVYVTDHTLAPKQVLAGSDDEEQEAAEYERQLADYNKTQLAQTPSYQGKYRKGSLLQRILDPFANAPRAADGAMEYNLEEKELANTGIHDEEALKKQYDEHHQQLEVMDFDPEDPEVMANLLEQLA